MAFSGGTHSTITRPPWALGLCDRCGFSYLLNQLKEEYYDARQNGLLVCPTCLDRDQEQLRLGRYIVTDPQSLLDPRPDVGRAASTSYFGWSPVGNEVTNIQCRVGTVTVS